MDKKDIFPFERLPGELKNKIYEYSLDWNVAVVKWLESCDRRDEIQLLDLVEPHAPYLAKLRKEDMLQRTLSTPTILLLNRQITREAVGILRPKPLKIVIPIGGRTMGSFLGSFVGRRTTEKVQILELEYPKDFCGARHTGVIRLMADVIKSFKEAAALTIMVGCIARYKVEWEPATVPDFFRIAEDLGYRRTYMRIWNAVNCCEFFDEAFVESGLFKTTKEDLS